SSICRQNHELKVYGMRHPWCVEMLECAQYSTPNVGLHSATVRQSDDHSDYTVGDQRTKDEPLAPAQGRRRRTKMGASRIVGPWSFVHSSMAFQRDSHTLKRRRKIAPLSHRNGRGAG